MSELNRLLPQIKDLNDQRPGPLVIIAANGQASPIYADDFTIVDGVFIAYRVNGDSATVDATLDGRPIYACAVSETRFFAAEVLNLKSIEELERESFANHAAQKKLMTELVGDPKTELGLSQNILPETTAIPGQYL